MFVVVQVFFDMVADELRDLLAMDFVFLLGGFYGVGLGQDAVLHGVVRRGLGAPDVFVRSGVSGHSYRAPGRPLAASGGIEGVFCDDPAVGDEHTVDVDVGQFAGRFGVGQDAQLQLPHAAELSAGLGEDRSALAVGSAVEAAGVPFVQTVQFQFQRVAVDDAWLCVGRFADADFQLAVVDSGEKVGGDRLGYQVDPIVVVGVESEDKDAGAGFRQQQGRIRDVRAGNRPVVCSVLVVSEKADGLQLLPGCGVWVGNQLGAAGHFGYPAAGGFGDVAGSVEDGVG